MSAPAILAVLPKADQDSWSEKGWQHEIAPHPGEVRIYIRNFLLPRGVFSAGYGPPHSLAVRVPAVEPRHVLDETRCAPD